MAFPPQFLDDLRARVSLADVIGRRVKLIRRGRELTGLCPFHNEKTPSFTVSEDKGFFHCFGCGAHGDVIGFVMRAESLGFLDAVEKLAGEAGMTVPQSTPEERQRAERAKSLIDVVEAAAAWFEERMHGSDGRAARRYLQERGLDEATMRRFRIGWAPDDRKALDAHLARQGFPAELVAEAGLVKQPDDGRPRFVYFRGRVMFPIADRRGRVVGFGGRLLGDGEPKYLNSPETPLFHKGRLLYGLSLARAAAREAGEVIVVEGYMDVIALAQAGLHQTVAPLGTALTEQQLGELWRLAPEPVLCLDGDAAGERASTRAARLALPLLKPDFSLRFAALPSGQDPDTLIRQDGLRALRAVIEEARPLADVLWAMERAGRALDTPERRAGLKARLGKLVSEIRDSGVQELYRDEFRRRFDDAFGTPRWSPGRGGRAGPRPPAGAGSFDRRAGTPRDGGFGARVRPEALRLRAYQGLLAALITHPHLLSEVDEALAGIAFPNEPLESLRTAILCAAADEPDLDFDTLRGHLSRKGFTGLLGSLLSNDVFVHAGFARPDRSDEVAGEGVRHLIALLREQDARSENAAAERSHAQEMTEASLGTLKATQQPIREGELQTVDLDRFEDVARRKPK